MTAVQAPEAASFDAAYRDLIASGRLQTSMKQAEVPRTDIPQWLKDLLAFLNNAGDFWQIVFWIGVTLLVALILWLVIRRLAGLGWRRGEAEKDQPANLRPEDAPARALLGDADRLAGEGRFAEAAHLLLFHSLEDIERRLPDFLRPALTSRDIGAAAALPGSARAAFSDIAGIVERGIFAVRPVGEDGWREARTAYERFAFGDWA